MASDLPKNLDFLLNQEWVEEFFTRNSEKIFQVANAKIEVLYINRAFNMAPQSYIMFYNLKVNGQEQKIRASSSTLVSRSRTFEIMQYIYSYGFNDKNIGSPEPICYFKDLNLMLYHNITGMPLLYLLEEKIDHSPSIILAAKAIKKIHQIPPPTFDLPEPQWDMNLKRISKYFDRVKIEKKITKIKINLNRFQKVFCHGDFQPNNLIVKEQKMTVIDFGSVRLAPPEFDLASFATQLEIMLYRAGSYNQFETLKNLFLNEYDIFDHQCFFGYSFYHSLFILDSLIAFFEDDPNPDKSEVSNAIRFWNNKINNFLNEN